jgi:transglutaminase-like putative cysteine protease
MNKYLASTEIIDWLCPQIREKAQELSHGITVPAVVAKACFVYVRDEIKHSSDHKINPVTCKASDVLQYKTGFCYAKSHLLAALLRASNIQAGLCYQRLCIDDEKPPFCLHGLNAVYLPDTGWYRIDARGNKKGVAADFTPPEEQLAFPVLVPGEAELPEIWAEPLPEIIKVLERFDTFQDVLKNLPDVEIINI